MGTTKNLLLRLDPELAEQLQAIAAVEERPVSEIVREAIANLVEARRTDTGFQRLLKQSARRQRKLLEQLQDHR